MTASTPPTGSTSTTSYLGQQPIVFFDGDCVMCNGFAERLLQIDPSGRVLIATLQGETAQRYLPPLPVRREEWSFYYLDHRGFYSQSEALIQLCTYLGGFWTLVGMMRLMPAPLRDTTYRWIAKNRYQWFGRRSACRMPTTEEQARFLS